MRKIFTITTQTHIDRDFNRTRERDTSDSTLSVKEVKVNKRTKIETSVVLLAAAMIFCEKRKNVVAFVSYICKELGEEARIIQTEK